MPKQDEVQQLAADLAKAVWMHAQKRLFTWTLESMERALKKCLNTHSAKSCSWKNEGEYWETDCGNAFTFTAGDPTENRMKFCPYCGKALQHLPGVSEEK